MLTTNSVLDRISSLQQQVSEQNIAPNVSSTLHRNRSSLHSAGQGALGKKLLFMSWYLEFKLSNQAESKCLGADKSQ